MRPAESDDPITELLERWGDGDEQALHDVTAAVYRRLSDMAHHRRRAEGRDHTLETAGLVHEVFLRLADGPTRLTDRGHFFRLASRIMRNVLVDHARANQAAKRGGGLVVTLNDEMAPVQAGDREIGRLNDAIEQLARHDPGKAQMVDLVYFGGFSGTEAAEIMGMPPSSFYRELSFARAWLKAELAPE